jgi:O-antigen ligase
MTMPARDRFNEAALWIAVAMGFSIPVSTALDTLLMAALLLCWIAGGRFREKWAAIRGNAIALGVIGFVLLHVLGAMYTLGDRTEVLLALDKASTLLLVPILVSLQPGVVWVRRALGALLAALALTLLLSYPLWLGFLPDLGFIKGFPYDPVVFKKKIGHSVLVAFGAFLAVLAARDAASAPQRLLLWLFGALAAFNVFFMVWGRTGQLVFAALAVYFLVDRFRWRGVIAAVLGALAIGGAAYLAPSSSLHVRTLATIKEYKDWRAGKIDRVVNARLETWSNSVQIAQQHPILGVGTGGFGAAYARQVDGSSMVPATHPENQYLLTAVQLGGIGLAALFALFAAQWRLAARLGSRFKMDLARGLVILMVVGCLFNSFLRDHAHALFYAWLSGLLYAALRPRGSPGAAQKV